jgi:uncharacterized protein YwgA
MSNYSEIWDDIAELQNQRAIEEKRRAKLTEVERLQEKLESQEQDVLKTKREIAEAEKRSK